MSATPRPPRWAAWLLARALPPGSFGHSVRRDLEAEFEQACATGSAAAARRWYAWEAVKLAARFTWEAIRPGRGPGGGGGMEHPVRNVRLALRRLGRSPGFTVVAALTMALGIGANVAIFSVVDAVLLDPLPYRDADALVAVYEWRVEADNRTNVVNPGNWRAWRDRSEGFASMTAVSMLQPVTVRHGAEARETVVQYADPVFFDVLGMEAALGRTFVSSTGGAEGFEVVLADDHWRERFGADPDVLGRSLDINGSPAVVVGVLPPEYVVFGEGTEMWVSLDLTRGDQTNSGRWLFVVGRRADGVTFEGAAAELRTIMSALRDEYPDFNDGWDVNPVPLKQSVVGDVSQALWILLGAVGVLLLIACANVANLFLVRATERQREMAVRTSLGASGRALAALLLTESFLVAAMGAALGVGLAYVGTGLLAHRMPDAFAMPRVEAAGVDATVLGFALGLSALTGLLFGLVPALQAARTSPAATLNAEGRGPSRRTGLLRNGLVVGEVALSVVLLAGAALFGRSLVTLLNVDPGIEPDQVVAARVNLSGPTYGADGERARIFDRLLTRLEERPGVASAGGITFLPMDGMGAATGLWPGDRPPPPADSRTAADIRNVAGDYFGTMGITLLDGRVFDARDGADGPRTVVVSRALAERFWPDERAVGKPLVIDWVDHEPWEIVGVVEDVHLQGLDAQPGGVVYHHYPKAPFFSWLHIVVRAGATGEATGTALREELDAVAAGAPLGTVRSMSDVVRRSAARPRMTTFLMLVFAGMATLLAAVGLYGVLSYAVSQRVREIGVRIAIGARPRDVLALVVRQGTGLVAVGLVLGLGTALLGGGVVSALLFGIEPRDPLALAGAAGLLFAVALVACVLPAWQASRVPPSEALRAE
ncbi:MAG: ABC transporter permease [Longimicrobiales bacterium]